MATSTPRLALTKPAGTDLVSLADINANYDKLDTNAGIFLCTSVTRPGTPYSGQLIFETDTRRILQWSGTSWVNHSIGVLVCTTATRPTVPYNGQLIQDTDTNQILIRNGGTWTVIANVTSNTEWVSFVPTKGSGSTFTSYTNGYSAYRVINRTATFFINGSILAAQPQGASNFNILDIPSAIHGPSDIFVSISGYGEGASNDSYALPAYVLGSYVRFYLPAGVSARNLSTFTLSGSYQAVNAV
jgi:hypothetical protein